MGFSLHWLLLLQSMGSGVWAHSLWCSGLATLRYVESPWRRDQTDVPCIGRQILNDWTTRVVLFLKKNLTGLWLISSAVLVSGGQQSESVMPFSVLACFRHIVCPLFLIIATHMVSFLLIYFSLSCIFSSHDFCWYFLVSFDLTSFRFSFPVLLFSSPFLHFPFILTLMLSSILLWKY